MSVGSGPARGVEGLQLLCGAGSHCDDVLELAMERYAAIIDGTSAREGIGLGNAEVQGATAQGARARQGEDTSRLASPSAPFVDVETVECSRRR